MITRCSICKRTHGQKGYESEGISSNLCAKCYAEFYKDNMDDLAEAFKNNYVLPEEKGDVVWEGPEKSYDPDDLVYYNQIVAEVRRELSEKRGEARDTR